MIATDYIFGKKRSEQPTQQYNTMIGGGGNIWTTASEMASGLGILESDISFFEIVYNNDIRARIEVSYQIPDSCFNNIPNRPGFKGYPEGLESYVDFEGKCTDIGKSAFAGQGWLHYVEFPAVVNIGIQAFEKTEVRYLNLPAASTIYGLGLVADNLNIRSFIVPEATTLTGETNALGGIGLLYMPKCTNFTDSEVTDDGVFLQSKNNIEIWADSILQTINGGAEEPDIAWARANLAASITYDTTPSNFDTTPDPITDLTITDIFAHEFRVNFTPPASVNGIICYEMILNGFTKAVEPAPGELFYNDVLDDTTHEVQIRTVDKYGNSSLSNIVTVQTLKADRIQNVSAGLLAHFNFDGDLTESVQGNNGTAYGSPTFETGLIGQSLKFNGIDQYVQTPFVPPTGNAARTFILWIKTTDSPQDHDHIIEYGEDANYKRFALKSDDGQLRFEIAGWGYTETTAKGTLNDGTWRMIGVVYDPSKTEDKIILLNNEDRIYVDSTAELNTGNGALGIAKDVILDLGRWYTGEIENLSVWEVALNPRQIKSVYNNGIGLKHI